MYRIDNATASGALPAPTADGPNPDSYFTDGNPGLGVPATVVDAEWANMVQEELCEVIEGAGLTLDKSDRTQLLQAIDTRIAPAASETVAGKIEIATSAEAAAGTSDTHAITPLKLRNGLNASGSAPVYAPRAWVNFDGDGAIVIRASGNVTSVTDNGTGDYTVNLTTAMSSANYCAIACHEGLSVDGTAQVANLATGSFKVLIGRQTGGGTPSPEDSALVTAIVVG